MMLDHLKSIFRWTLLVWFGLMIGCSTEDDTHDLSYHAVPIVSFNSADTGIILEQMEIEITYRLQNGCQSFGNFDIRRDGLTRTVVVIARETDGPCTLEIEEETRNLIFEPQEAGDYTFRFGTAVDEDGTISYTDHMITVQPN